MYIENSGGNMRQDDYRELSVVNGYSLSEIDALCDSYIPSSRINASMAHDCTDKDAAVVHSPVCCERDQVTSCKRPSSQSSDFTSIKKRRQMARQRIHSSGLEFRIGLTCCMLLCLCERSLAV